MAQLQRIDARLDTLTTELYQVNTRVGRIGRWQARLSGFAASPQDLVDEDIDDGTGDDDEDEDASSSNNDETTSQ